MDDRLTVVETRNCKEIIDGKVCGRSFVITKGNKQFFESKGMPLPIRCEQCRLRRRTSIKGTMQIPLK